MVSVTPNSSSAAIQGLIQRALQHRCLSRQEHLQLTSAMLSNAALSASERHQINRVFDYIRLGKVHLID